jgi:hypothetical protein
MIAMMAGMLMLMVAARPPNPLRQSPPPGIEEHALHVGAAAPAFTLPDANGGRWSLHGPAVLVFYRGYW